MCVLVGVKSALVVACCVWFSELSPVEEKEGGKDAADGAVTKRRTGGGGGLKSPPAVVEPPGASPVLALDASGPAPDVDSPSPVLPVTLTSGLTSPTDRSRSHTRVHKSASASALTLLIPPHGAFCRDDPASGVNIGFFWAQWLLFCTCSKLAHCTVEGSLPMLSRDRLEGQKASTECQLLRSC